jgi:purine nucleoside phosphorylase
MLPGRLALPNQIIDYTYGREHTFFDGTNPTGDHPGVEHIDFSQPYCETLRQQLLAASCAANIALTPQAIYGASQGPRLESSAEIRRLAQDGCDVVGMTGMPETALARELGLCYASCAVVVNWAEGLTEEPITMDEIRRHLVTSMAQVRPLLTALLALR